MDRSNKFRKITQGVIHLRFHPEAVSGIRPQLRVENNVGFIDMRINNVTFTTDNFELSCAAIYKLWRKEIRDTIEILGPDITRFKFVELSLAELKDLLVVSDLTSP